MWEYIQMRKQESIDTFYILSGSQWHEIVVISEY